jgi:hypothetical protein
MYYLFFIVLLLSLFYRVWQYKNESFWKDNVIKVNQLNVLIDKYLLLFLLPIVYVYLEFVSLELNLLLFLNFCTFFRFIKKDKN